MKWTVKKQSVCVSFVWVQSMSGIWARGAWFLASRETQVKGDASRSEDRWPVTKCLMTYLLLYPVHDFTTKFLDIKTLLRDHTGAKVSLAKFQSSSNVKGTTCMVPSFFSKSPNQIGSSYWCFSLLNSTGKQKNCVHATDFILIFWANSIQKDAMHKSSKEKAHAHRYNQINKYNVRTLRRKG